MCERIDVGHLRNDISRAQKLAHVRPALLSCPEECLPLFPNGASSPWTQASSLSSLAPRVQKSPRPAPEWPRKWPVRLAGSDRDGGIGASQGHRFCVRASGTRCLADAEHEARHTILLQPVQGVAAKGRCDGTCADKSAHTRHG